MEHTAKMTTAVGTYAWMAPEVRYRVLYPMVVAIGIILVYVHVYI